MLCTTHYLLLYSLYLGVSAAATGFSISLWEADLLQIAVVLLPRSVAATPACWFLSQPLGRDSGYGVLPGRSQTEAVLVQNL